MPGPSLGTNLAGVVDWSTQFPFLDLMKMSRTWFTQSEDEWDSGDADQLTLDQNGWVTDFGGTGDFNRVSTILFTAGDDYLPSGRYILDWQGEGELEVIGNGNWTIVEQTDGRVVLELSANADYDTLSLSILSTDPGGTGDYLRDIRLYHEDDAALIAAGEIFTPEFLAKIEDFRSLRFMDWTGTNNSTVTDWDEAAGVADARWVDGHMPVQVMVELANQVGADPWFCIPHLASDAYIRAFVTYVRDNLDPGLVARFEYSNEVWNWGFQQAQWANDQARATWGEDVEGGWMQWYGARAANMANIVAEVFGAETGTRALNVFSTQSGWQGLEQYALDSPESVADGFIAPRDAPFHVYAIAPYFGGSIGSDDPAMVARVEGWIAAGEQGFLDAIAWIRSGDSADSLGQIGATIAYHAAVAAQLGWSLEAYEGGQHVVDLAGLFGGQQNPARDQFFVDLVARPEFEQLYIEYLQIWRDNGGGLMEQFSDVGEPSRYGSWGIWESIYSGNSSRADAIEHVRDTIAAWWDDPRDASVFDAGHLLRGRGSADTLTGGAAADRLYGNGGSDVLNGGPGQDLMVGGDGNDTFHVDNAGDVIAEAKGGGTDTVISSVTYVLQAGVYVENLTLTGTANLNGTGNGIANTLIGNAGVNVLSGGKGDDILDGKLGADTLNGGLGDDLFIVDNPSEVLIELAGEGYDTAHAWLGYTLPVNVEVLILFGPAVYGTGNTGANLLVGNANNNKLNGLGGDDVMMGGVGDDTYYVDSAGDQVIERVGEGNDRVLAYVSYTLGAESYVQRLTLMPTAEAIVGVGNRFANTIVGNANANRLEGAGGADVLDGATGDDALDGGAGADTMIGGQGNDTYVVDNVGDVIVEVKGPGAGADAVLSSVSFTLRPGVYVEDLTLTGTANIHGTGNGLSNVIRGNAGDNVLDGGSGGSDRMYGGAGDDVFHVNSAGDRAYEAKGGGTDHVFSSVSYTLNNQYVEFLTLTGSADAYAKGNSLDNRLVGNSGDNRINGMGGQDRLTGGAGSDTFIWDKTSHSKVSDSDRIVDLSDADFIDLSRIDADVNVVGTQHFVLVDAFTNTAGQVTLSFDGAFTNLRADTNGDGVADMLIRINGDHTDFDNFIFGGG